MKRETRKYQRSLIFSKCGKTIEEELTYDKFVECLKSNFEFFFIYKDKTIDIAYHIENDVKIYEFNINGNESDAQNFEFQSVEELLKNAKIEKKTLFEIWDELKT